MRYIIFPSLLALALCSCRYTYREYVPTYFNGNNFYTSKDSLTAQHKKNIMHVFEYNKVRYKEVGGILFYKGNIDQDLMWNFTSKANDSVWLRTH